MGDRLLKIYEEAGSIGGLPARVALARYTSISAIAAQNQ